MAGAEPEKLVVFLMDGRQDLREQGLRDIVTQVNGRQSYVEVVLDQTSKPHGPEVLIIDGDGTGPYYYYPSPHTKNSIAIDLAFYGKYSAAVPLAEYISYFIAIIVLEYLYRKWVGQDLRIYKTYEHDKVKGLVWSGSVTLSAKSIVEQFQTAHQGPDRKPVLDATVTLMRAGFQRSVELTQWARQVAGHLNSLELPSALDSYTNVQSHFHNVGPA
ncbi:MAG: hypothetical protein GY832_41615, partial [Chloroflexi bacterium]|nr:hypothetical protein [Chloroflexota bacterium]